jgi:hypothetical protein
MIKMEINSQEELNNVINEMYKNKPYDKFLIMDNVNNYDTIINEFKIQYNIEVNVTHGFIELTNLIKENNYRFIFFRTNDKEEIKQFLEIINHNCKDSNLILLTTNLDEKFLWYVSRYFGDILKEIDNAKSLIRRIHCMFNMIYERINKDTNSYNIKFIDATNEELLNEFGDKREVMYYNFSCSDNEFNKMIKEIEEETNWYYSLEDILKKCTNKEIVFKKLTKEFTVEEIYDVIEIIF